MLLVNNVTSNFSKFLLFNQFLLNKLSTFNNSIILLILLAYILKESVLIIFFKDLISYCNQVLFVLFIFFVFINFKTKISNIVIFLMLISILMIGYMLNINQIASGGKNAFLLTVVVLGLLLIRIENINFDKLNKSIIIISSIITILSIFLFCLGLQLSSDAIVMNQSIMTGIFTNPNQAGLIFLLLLILILNTSRKYSKVTISISVLLVISIVFTLSRASIIAMVILLFYFLIKNKKLLIVAFASILIFFISNSYVSNKLISKFTEQGSSHRTEIWSAIVSERTNSLENFFFGTGSNTTYFILDGGKLSAHSSIVDTFGNFCFINTYLYPF